MALLKARIKLGESQDPLKISDVFEDGQPNREERRDLRRALRSLKSLNKKSDNSQQLTSNSRLDESTEPFVSTSTLGNSTEYINAAGNALGTAISSIQFTPITKGTDFKVSTYGNLGEYHIDINGKKEGKSSTGSAVINIERLNNKVSGLDALVKDSLSSLTPIDEITGSSQQQIVPYSAKSNSGYSITDETDLYLKAKAYFPDGFPLYGALAFSMEVKGTFGLISPYGAMDAQVDSIINYDTDKKQANLGNYDVGDIIIKPSMADAWGRYWQATFGDVSAWWDDKISKKNNPFAYIKVAVDDQLTSGENLLTNQAETVVTNQLNSPGIKPYIDGPFQVLYGAAWDRKTYPLSGGWAEG